MQVVYICYIRILESLERITTNTIFIPT